MKSVINGSMSNKKAIRPLILETATGVNITVYGDAIVMITIDHNEIKTVILVADIMDEIILGI